MFIHENAFENVVSKMSSMKLRPRYVNRYKAHGIIVCFNSISHVYMPDRITVKPLKYVAP